MTATRSFAPLLLLALVGSARAQSTSAFGAAFDYSFSVAQGAASDLTFVAHDILTFNFFYEYPDPRVYQPYIDTKGTGTVVNTFSPTEGWNAANLSGTLGYTSVAHASLPSGSAQGSVGQGEVVEVANHGTSAIVLDFTATATLTASLSRTGPRQYPSNYVTVSAYNLIRDDRDDSVGGSVTYEEQDMRSGPLQPVAYGWTALGGDLFRTASTVTILPGDTHSFEILSYGNNVAAAVPEPASLAALSLGAVAVLRRRKRG